MANGHHRSFNDSRFAELSKSKTRNYIRKNNKQKAPLPPGGQTFADNSFLMILKGTIGEKIDGKFRKIYPAVFGFFNVVYWFTYLKGK